MKHNGFKRLLSLLMSAVLCLGLCPVSALAADGDTVSLTVQIGDQPPLVTQETPGAQISLIGKNSDTQFFSHWEVVSGTKPDGVDLQSSALSFEMPAEALSLKAVLEDRTADVTVTVVNGRIGNTGHSSSQSFTLKQTPRDGVLADPSCPKAEDMVADQDFAGGHWQDGKAPGNPLNFDSVQSYTYVFDPLYEITAQNCIVLDAEKKPLTEALAGTTLYLQAQAPEGQQLIEFICGEQHITPEKAAAGIPMPAADSVFRARFGYSVTVKGGTAKGDTVKMAEPGSDVTLEVPQQAGKTLTGWTADPQDLNFKTPATRTISFKMPECNVTLTPNFQELSATVTFQAVTPADGEDKTQVLDTLTLALTDGKARLTNAQIPAPENRDDPAETGILYGLGKWDQTPDVNTDITEDVTYTLRYQRLYRVTLGQDVQPEGQTAPVSCLVLPAGKTQKFSYTGSANTETHEGFDHWQAADADGNPVSCLDDPKKSAVTLTVPAKDITLNAVTAPGMVQLIVENGALIKGTVIQQNTDKTGKLHLWVRPGAKLKLEPAKTSTPTLFQQWTVTEMRKEPVTTQLSQNPLTYTVPDFKQAGGDVVLSAELLGAVSVQVENGTASYGGQSGSTLLVPAAKAADPEAKYQFSLKAARKDGQQFDHWTIGSCADSGLLTKGPETMAWVIPTPGVAPQCTAHFKIKVSFQAENGTLDPELQTLYLPADNNGKAALSQEQISSVLAAMKPNKGCGLGAWVTDPTQKISSETTFTYRYYPMETHSFLLKQKDFQRKDTALPENQAPVVLKVSFLDDQKQPVVLSDKLELNAENGFEAELSVPQGKTLTVEVLGSPELAVITDSGSTVLVNRTADLPIQAAVYGAEPDAVTVLLGAAPSSRQILLEKSGKYRTSVSAAIYDADGKPAELPAASLPADSPLSLIDSQVTDQGLSLVLSTRKVLSAAVVWQDENGKPMTPPASAALTLGLQCRAADAKGPWKDLDGIPFSGEKGWTKQLSVNEYSRDGKLLTYQAVAPQAPEGYRILSLTGSEAEGFTLTLQKLPPLRVNVLWKTSTGKSIVRPADLDSIQVDVLRNGSKIKTLKLNEGNHWSGEVSVSYLDSDGKEYTYTILPQAAAGFTYRITGDALSGFQVTYTLQKDTRDLTALLVLKDEAGNIVPPGEDLSLLLGILRNGQPIHTGPSVKVLSAVPFADGDMTLLLTKDNTWKEVIRDLPIYSPDGLPWEYSLEILKTNSSLSFTITGNFRDGFQVNARTRIPDNKVKVRIDWQDADGKPMAAPENMTDRIVRIYGRDVADPKNPGTWEVLTDATLTAKNKWAEEKPVPSVNGMGHPLAYRVDLARLPYGFRRTVTGNQKDGFVITLRLDNESRTLILQKFWKNTAGSYVSAPKGIDSVIIDIYRNDELYRSVELLRSQDWTAEIQVPGTDAQWHMYNYSARERKVPAGYRAIITANVDGFDIVNKQTREHNSNPWTGDSSHIGLWAGAGILAAAGLIYLAVSAGKKKKKK